MDPDTWHWLRIQAVGDQVRARIWDAAATEPTGWEIETTATTYQEKPISGRRSTHTTEADWDDFQVADWSMSNQR